MFKNIIWRRPFVTKKQREKAKHYMDVMMTYQIAADAAQHELERDDLTLDQRSELFRICVESSCEAIKYGQKSARYLGFRNIMDANRWLEKHKSP